MLVLPACDNPDRERGGAAGQALSPHSDTAPQDLVAARRCTDSEGCAPGEFCDLGEACGAEGSCESELDGCAQGFRSMELDPVCGCDGETYASECDAHEHGVSVDHHGECVGGCTGNDECAADEFCRRDDFDCGGVGECAERPTVCSDLSMPVCSCDGEDYSNACVAHAFGQNVDYLGACE